MRRMKITGMIGCVFILLLSSCNYPLGMAGTNEPNQDASVADMQTQVAGMVADTQAAQTAVAQAVIASLAAGATDTPEFTPTPSFTFTPTSTFTLQVPMLSSSVNMNCRSGPGMVYDILGYLKAGQTVEVVGRSEVNHWWIIKLPSNPAITCTVSEEYASVVGDTSGLPVVNAPPTPTPIPDFSFSYDSWGVGPGTQCLYFEVTNSGGMTWESYHLAVHDETHGDSGSRSANKFISYDSWCVATVSRLDLTPGETGTASVVMSMSYDPSGDQFKATLTLCAGDDQTGSCMTKTINFNF